MRALRPTFMPNLMEIGLQTTEKQRDHHSLCIIFNISVANVVGWSMSGWVCYIPVAVQLYDGILPTADVPGPVLSGSDGADGTIRNTATAAGHATSIGSVCTTVNAAHSCGVATCSNDCAVAATDHAAATTNSSAAATNSSAAATNSSAAASIPATTTISATTTICIWRVSSWILICKGSCHQKPAVLLDGHLILCKNACCKNCFIYI